MICTFRLDNKRGIYVTWIVTHLYGVDTEEEAAYIKW